MTENNEPTTKIEIKPLNMQAIALRGAIIGAVISTFVSWNTGRYNKIGQAIRRAKFARRFIAVKKMTNLPHLNRYSEPQLNTVTNNFFCYSGEPGIGKSFHFNGLITRESLRRPTLYLNFKTVGKDTNFENDLSEQLKFGEDGTGMVSEIIRAAKRIAHINKKPERFWLKYIFTHLSFLGLEAAVYGSSLDATVGMVLLGSLVTSHCYYCYFAQPFLAQSLRRTIPLIIMDDINKIEHMGMLSELVRFLKLIEEDASNIMLVSSDEQTWTKLRKEPGMKDRLRVRQVKYDHQETSLNLLEIIDQHYDAFMKEVNAHSVYDQELVKALVKELIGNRQMTLRRFISILKLNDEEEYDLMLSILKGRSKSITKAVAEFTKGTHGSIVVLFGCETNTMLSNIKTIKRELAEMSQDEYIDNLRLLLVKYKLPPDNKIASHLKSFNIVRDLGSEYVINGRFTFIVYQMAVQEYEEDILEYFGEINNRPSEEVTSSSDVQIKQQGQVGDKRQSA